MLNFVFGKIIVNPKFSLSKRSPIFNKFFLFFSYYKIILFKLSRPTLKAASTTESFGTNFYQIR